MTEEWLHVIGKSIFLNSYTYANTLESKMS